MGKTDVMRRIMREKSENKTKEGYITVMKTNQQQKGLNTKKKHSTVIKNKIEKGMVVKKLADILKVL